MSFIFLPGIFFYSVHEDDIYDAYVSVNSGVHNYSFRPKGTLCLSNNLVASIT